MHPTYYIGDVHGMAGPLDSLLRWIEDDAASAGVAPRVGFLGDIVDRGPDSRACMDMVCDVIDRWPGSVLHLGNHDAWFLDVIATKGKTSSAESWVLNGGVATVESYCGGTFDPNFFDVVVGDHPRHVEAMKAASLQTRNGPFTAVHAGLDPRVPADGQTRETLLWIRDPFLRHVDPRFGPVIHGHTPVGKRPVVTENRISLDTGAYDTGILSCLALGGDGSLRFAAATPKGATGVEPVALDRGHGTLLDRPKAPRWPPPARRTPIAPRF